MARRLVIIVVRSSFLVCSRKQNVSFCDLNKMFIEKKYVIKNVYFDENCKNCRSLKIACRVLVDISLTLYSNCTGSACLIK